MAMVIFRRLGMAVPTLLGVSLLIWLLLSILPGDPLVALLPQDATPEDRAALEESLGLDQPLPVRYVQWLGNVVQGDFGYSPFRRRDVSELISTAWKNTAVLAAVSATVGLSLGLLAGTVAGVYRGRWIDRVVTSSAIVGLSVPSFWVAILLLIIFSAELKILPAGGRADLADGLFNYAKYLVMPVIAGSLITIAITARVARASIVETYQAEFVELLRAKGLREWQVLVHVGKNAVSPVLTTAGLQVGYLLGGSVLIETIYSWPGLGQLVFNAIAARDLLVVQATTLLIAVTFVLLNLAVDILQVTFDPRQKRAA
ncbi:MAG: peptide ABC transporter permease [Chloroflexota bacterium]